VLVAALIPAFREERFIRDVVTRTRAALETVLVIDDGSTDATGAEAEAAGATVLRHPSNWGKGAAIKTGLRHLLDQGFDYVLLLDGDGQHLPEEIPRFLEEASRSGTQMIIGNRLHDLRDMPPVRKITNLFMSACISNVCKTKIPDSQCGFRMLHRSLIPHVFCETNNFDYETEMILIAARQKFSIAAVPISTVYGEEKSKIHPVRDTIRWLRLLARYRQGGST
jgi:glycosyltransferase involved in cell wall biosynthesis